MMNSLVGVVICNSSASRLKHDKGLIKRGDSTWAEIVYTKLQSVIDKTYISINSTQLENYKKIFPESILIEDKTALKGIIAALFTIHKGMPGKDIFILSCEMLNMDEDTIDKMIAEYKTHKNLYDYFVYKKQVNIEPLAGIYSSRGLEQLYHAYFSGNLPGASIKYILATGNTYAVKIRDKDKFTSPEETANSE